MVRSLVFMLCHCAAHMNQVLGLAGEEGGAPAARAATVLLPCEELITTAGSEARTLETLGLPRPSIPRG